MNSKSENIIKLNNSNYFNWKYRMELVLIEKDLWETITDEAPTGERALARWAKKDQKARAAIGLAVEDNQLVHVRGKRSAAETWEALREVHEKDTLVNKIHLIKRISTLRMKDDGNMENHINELSSLFQRLLDLGDTQLSDEWKVGFLLASLPQNYSTLVTALEVRPSKDLTWSLVHAKLMDEYQRQKDLSDSRDDKYHEQVMKISKSEKLHCHFCKRENHKMVDCIKLKQYKQFQEFSEMQQNDKEKEYPREKQHPKEHLNTVEDDDEEFVLCINAGSCENFKSKWKSKTNIKNWNQGKEKFDDNKKFNDSIFSIKRKIHQMETWIIELEQIMNLKMQNHRSNHHFYRFKGRNVRSLNQSKNDLVVI